MSFRHLGYVILYSSILVESVPGDEPLHARIDAAVEAKWSDGPAAELAGDVEFLRRVFLDLAGTIPTAEQVRDFLGDKSAAKRTAIIEELLDGADHPRRMQELFHVMLMERRGDDKDWLEYLRKSFEANKPWDRLAQEILQAGADDESARAAAFFYTKRLEKYGTNPVDYPGLTRDVSRLFLGMDLQCAQCHSHLFIDDYTQEDFQGLFIAYQNLYVRKDVKFPAVGENMITKKLEYMSVFDQAPLETGPRLPDGPAIEIPVFAKGEEYLVPPDKKTRAPGVPRFSPLAELAQRIPTGEYAPFSRNIVNRFWFVMMGRGLVHPLDLHHSDNPASHPELLDLLAREFVAHGFDGRWLLRELASTRTYQRSSRLPAGLAEPPAPESYRVALERRLSAEQLYWSTLRATGNEADPDLRQRFVEAFGNPQREPEIEFEPSVQSALFLRNDPMVLELFHAKPGNLIDRLSAIEDAGVLADELFLTVVTRLPSDEDRRDLADFLASNPDHKAEALGHFAWALLTSTEFRVNH